MLSAVRKGTSLTAACRPLTGASGWGSSPAPAPIRTLHIGVDLPLTGADSRATLPARNGVRFYVQQHPSIAGFQVSIVPLDDTVNGRSNAKQGVANLENFISDSNLVAMIGPFNASLARKEIPIANVASLAIISPPTTNPHSTNNVSLPSHP